MLTTGTPTRADDPERWARIPDSIEEFLQHFPSHDANRTALEVERIAAEIGIDLAPHGLPDRARPESGAAALFEKTRASIEKYVKEELKRPDPGVNPPPPAVASFLLKRQGSLAAVRECLAHGDPPTWERHLEKLVSTPPADRSFYGEESLQELLAADALSRESGGDERGALEDLDAAWTLSSALRDDPTVNHQDEAVWATRLQAGVLRHIAAVPPVWSDRLHEHDYRESMLAALQFEGWTWTQFDSAPWLEGRKNLSSRAIAFAGGPYYRASLRNTAELWARYLARLAARRSSCDVDPAVLESEFLASIPWWNRIAPAMIRGFTELVSAVARLDVDLELTSRILDLQADRRRTGTWPRSLTDAGESAACPGAQWKYDVALGSGRSIALDRKLTPPPRYRLSLPTEFKRIRPDFCGKRKMA